MIDDLKPGKHLRDFDLEEAIKTIRKLPLFGYNGYQPDFEWPKDQDLLAMPDDNPIKVVGFNWKTSI